MGFKFYKLAEEKVIITKTDIPSDMWERKDLLPYEKIIVDAEAAEASVTNKIDIQSDKVVETETRYTVPKTLEQVKTRKLQEINFLCQEEILSKYSLVKQSSASLGIYPEKYVIEMKTFITEKINDSNLLAAKVNECTTIDNVNLIEIS